MVRPRAASLEVPASRYQVSLRPFPESLPAIEYEPGAHVRKVQDKGEISFGGKPSKSAKLSRLSSGDQSHFDRWPL